MLYLCIPDTSAWAAGSLKQTPRSLTAPLTPHIIPYASQRCCTGANHASLQCDLVACSRHCLPSHFVLQLSAHSHRKKPRWVLSKFSTSEIPNPLWHSDTFFPFYPHCPSNFQYFQLFLLDFRNNMKINSVFLSLTVLVYYSDFSCWSIGN